MMTGRRRSLALFFCAWAALLSASAKDVLYYKVTKGVHYGQRPNAAPTNLVENRFLFQANVRMTQPGSVRLATIRSQEGTVRQLTLDSPQDLEFRDRMDVAATFNARYPEGNFTFGINTLNEGNKTIVLQLTGAIYPETPRIANLSELQSVNARGYFIVRWDPFPGGTANDFIQLRIEDSGGDRVFKTPDFGEPGALDGTATYAVIDPRTLSPNGRYVGSLRFEKTYARNFTAYPDALGWSTYHKQTDFPIVTSSAASPVIELYEVAKGRQYEQGTPGPPVPDRNDEYRFQAQVEGSTSNLITSASVQPPGTNFALAPDPTRKEFSRSQSITTLAAFEATYPDGMYRFAVNTTTGPLAPAITLTGSNYPPAPHVLFNPQVDVRADRDLAISWDPWPGGTIHDFIQLRIEDTDDNNVFETPDLGENQALHGLSTSTVVPAGTLLPGKLYSGRLYFRRYTQFDTTSLPGSFGVAGYFSRVKFNIETVSPDVTGYALSKGAEYIQSTAGSPILSHYTFRATIFARGVGTVSNATITTPTGTLIPLPLQADRVRFAFFDTRPTRTEIDAAYPDGTYVFTVYATNDGIKTMQIPLTGSTYPSAPHIANWGHAGQVNPISDFALRWDRFQGGTPTDFIQCSLVAPSGAIAFRSPNYGEPNALYGNNFETTIIQETLAPGTVYTGNLLFEKVLPHTQTNYVQVFGRSTYFSRSRFTLVTLGPGHPATLSNFQVLPGNQVQFSFNRVTGAATYHIEGSPDLKTWTLLGSVPSSAGSGTFTSPRPSAPTYFYRTYLAR